MLGHYLSEGVNPDAEMDGSEDCWFTYDDSDVRLTTRDCVCQLRDESAYILFYHREVRGQQYPALGPPDSISIFIIVHTQIIAKSVRLLVNMFSHTQL